MCVCALLCLRTTTHARKLYAQHTIANALKKPIWAYLKCAHSYSPIRLVQFTHGIKAHAYTLTLSPAKWNFVWFTQWLYELLFKPKCLKWFSWSKCIHTDAFQCVWPASFWRKQKIRQPLEKYQGQIIFIIKLFASISNTIKCFEHLEVEHSKDHTVQIYICTMTVLKLLITNYARNLISKIWNKRNRLNCIWDIKKKDVHEIAP